MLEINEFLVLDFVREHGPTTRTDVARELGLSAASVSRIVARLRGDRLVTESGRMPSPGGRPRALISFRRDAGAIIAIDLGGTRCQAALADLSGTIVASDLRPTGADGDAFATLSAAIAAIQAEADRREVPVVALAVGVPGIVDPTTGTVRDAPYVGWDGFPLVERLATMVDVPFVVENDVNLAALAHAWRGDGRQVDDFVTLSVGTGTGGAIVSGGRLVGGAHNVAGELGYLVVRRELLGRPIEHGLGAFETVASGPGLAATARARIEAGRTSSLAVDAITPKTVVDAAAAGDAVAAEALDEVLDDLAIAIVALVCTVDPALVILEGGVGRSLGPWLESLASRVGPSVPSAPRVVVSSLGRDATVIGAVAAALELSRRHSAPAAVRGSFSIGGVARHAG
jgi:predicted NBD/HSP70 family sugar kinase